MTERKHPRDSKQDTPFLEWLVGGVGVLLLTAAVAFLISEGVKNDERPGAITASVKEVFDAGDMHIVTFELHNSGSQTLSNVHLSARLLKDNREVERVTTEIDYLPGRSSQEGGVYLRHDPKTYRLEIIPEGYQKP